MLEKYFRGLSEKPENVKVDLHMHSCVSDGTWTPEKLVRNVKDSDIKLFALTDHDDVGNVAETALYAKDAGLCLIPGVEVSSTWNGRTYHILGLGIDVGHKGLGKLLEMDREQYEEKDCAAVAYLEGLYPQISRKEFAVYQNNRERGGWKALNYLIDIKLCTDLNGYFKLFEGDGGVFVRLSFQPPAEVISIIKQAGGHAILAHPGVAFYDPDYRLVIDHMLHEGIQGIECYHPENGEDVRRYALDFCRNHNLLVTGGSDCHGDFLPSRRLGVPDVRLSDLVL